MSLEPQSGSSEEEVIVEEAAAKVQNLLVCLALGQQCRLPDAVGDAAAIKDLLQATRPACNVDAVGASYYIQVTERLL